MKIAIFSTTLDIRNGYGNITYEVCRRLKGRVDFTLFLPKSEAKYDYSGYLSKDETNDYPGYPVEYILPDFIFSFKNKDALDYLSLPKITGIENFDIIYSMFSFPYCLPAARLAKKHKKPLLIGAQGTFGVAPLMHWPEKHFLTWAYNQANQIIVPSQFTKEKIQEFSKTKTPIEIIHNGIVFSRLQEKQNLSELENKFRGKKTLLTVGGLKSRKGQDIVVRALAKVKSTYKDFHYFLISGQEGMAKLKQMVDDLGLTENVSFLGNVPEDELVKYFQFCDIYIHTPRNINWHFEGFGIVYLEASACGKPIIAADSGGIRNAVLEDKTGLIIPEEDVDGTAEAILKLFNNPQLAEELGRNGIEYAKENDWDIIIDKFLDVYKSVSSER